MKKTILIVDDEPNNIRLLKEILQGDYDIRVALNGRDALERAVFQPHPSLILLDIMMPEMDGYEVCKKIKSNPSIHKIPVVFVTAMIKEEDETRGFQAGAVDYIQKPIIPSIVRARVETHIKLSDQQRQCEENVRQRTEELEENQVAMINMLGEAGHYNDEDTGVHIWRMAAFSRALAAAMDWPVDKAAMLELAAPMHDTGKIGIPDAILKAPRSLTAEEWIIMRQHTTIGHNILSKSKTPLFNMASEIALSHHEKWNGGGYPGNLKNSQIPESARIVAIADVFDALTMKRPYKEAWPAEKAFHTIMQDAGKHFDPVLAAKFLEIKDEIVRIKIEWDKKEKE